jgi:hypothetical protein
LRKFIFFIFLVSCSSSRITTVNFLSDSSIIYDKVKLSYNDSNNKIVLRGKFSIVKDSVINFVFWGPLGMEVISGKIGNSLALKSQFSDSLNSQVYVKIFDTFGLELNRTMVENLLLLNSANLYKLLLNSRPQNVIVQFSSKNLITDVITLIDNNNKSTSMITFIKRERFPLEIFIEYIRKDYFLKVRLEVFNARK